MTRRDTLQSQLSRVDGVSPTDTRTLGKHSKMAQNPFRFLRGAAHLFYADIQSQLIAIPEELTQNIPLTSIMGDCHISNFGFFTEEGSHGETVIFAPNDFDDACIGHSIWDILRFLTSLYLSAEYCQGLLKGCYQGEVDYSDSGLQAPTQGDTHIAVSAFIRSYIDTCDQLVQDATAREQVLTGFKKCPVLGKAYKKARQRASGGKKFLSKSALAKAIDLTQYPLQFRDIPERFKAVEPREQADIIKQFRPYVDDAILAVVERLGAGTGSLNMPRYYLLVGPNSEQPEPPELNHIVEIKQQRSAAPLHWFPDLSPVNQLNPAHLTVACQQRMQRKPDLVLDEVEWRGQHWLVRSRHHAKVGIAPEDIALAPENAGEHLTIYAKTCGQALALAHSRGDRRSTRFEQAICRYLPAFETKVKQIALAYAAQSIQDQQLLKTMMS